MPDFFNHLPVLGKHMGFDLHRTDATKPLVGIITSEDFLATNTHFWGGRTVPHEIVNCPACLQNQPYRTHVYVSAIDPKTREHFIFECTSNAAKPFDEYRKAQGTLRGCVFQAIRPKGTKNGKVIIQTRPADLTKLTLPEPPNLPKALCVIWQIPYCNGSNNKPKIDRHGLRADQNDLKSMREQPDNAPDPPHVLDGIDVS